MTDFLGVMPFIVADYKNAAAATMCDELAQNTLFVDNTVDNIGIMASHNLAIDGMDDTTEWLIVMSAAIRFGPPGGADFLDALFSAPADTLVLEAAGVYGWHLIAFRRQVIDTVGRWDENFTPYGFDDIDYSIRFQLAYGISGVERQLWDKAVIDITDTGMAHSIHLAGVTSNTERQIDYFMHKWGRHPGESTVPYFQHPFNDPTKPVSYWPKGWWPQ